MSVRILQGDCRDVLPTLPAESVHCVVTSPPYYGLRDYGVAGQLGLEASPDAYLATMVDVFREVRRVLRDDGTLWLNMGDSYAGSSTNTNSGFNERWGNAPGACKQEQGRSGIARGGKPKDLLMMPARLALALQADGWWLRSDIIWHKPNPMPESCRDRCTSAHEHIFMLTKAPRYFFDADAIAEPAINAGRVVDYDGTQKNCSAGDAFNDMRTRIQRPVEVAATRSCRNVWTIATEPTPLAHFATYPTELVSRCIRAGTSERGCCARCGKPWVRNTAATFIPQQDVSLERGIKGAAGQKPMDATSGWDGVPRGTTERITTGWSPGCGCNADVVPCTVLDPFAGAGTTLLVADRLQRNAIGIELNPAYVAMAEARIASDAPLFDTMHPPVADAEAIYDRQADLFAAAAD